MGNKESVRCLTIPQSVLRSLRLSLPVSYRMGPGLTTPYPIKRSSNISQSSKKPISLLGEIQTELALPELLNLLEPPTLRVDAAKALGNFGSKAQKPLIAILNTHSEIPMKIAATQSLGKIGGTAGDTSLTPLYLSLLENNNLNVQLKTEIVWAIGKSPNFRTHSPLEALEHQIWILRSDDQNLREAVDWRL